MSFDETYLSNLVQSGMLPLQITQTVWDQLRGDELLNIDIKDRSNQELRAGEMIPIQVVKGNDENDEKKITQIEAKLRLDNSYEVKLFRNGGVIRDMLRKLNIDSQKWAFIFYRPELLFFNQLWSILFNVKNEENYAK